MQTKTMDQFFGEVVYSYSRAQAIADGVLIDVSELASEAGLKIPVAVTTAVWNDYIEWTDQDSEKQTYQDTTGRCWDVLWMLRFAIGKNKGSNQVDYQLYVVPRDGKSRDAKLTDLKAIIDGGDNGEPVLTILLPHED